MPIRRGHTKSLCEFSSITGNNGLNFSHYQARKEDHTLTEGERHRMEEGKEVGTKALAFFPEGASDKQPSSEIRREGFESFAEFQF